MTVVPRSLLDCKAIGAEIDHVRSLGVDALRTLWRTTLRSSPPPAFSKDLMARFLCWHIQEQAQGGLDPETAKHLDGLARGGKPGADRPRRLKPDTVLLREYQGERHTVTVVPNGYLWRETNLREPLDHRAGHHRHSLEQSPLLWAPRRGQSFEGYRAVGARRKNEHLARPNIVDNACVGARSRAEAVRLCKI